MTIATTYLIVHGEVLSETRSVIPSGEITPSDPFRTEGVPSVTPGSFLNLGPLGFSSSPIYCRWRGSIAAEVMAAFSLKCHFPLDPCAIERSAVYQEPELPSKVQ